MREVQCAAPSVRWQRYLRPLNPAAIPRSEGAVPAPVSVEFDVSWDPPPVLEQEDRFTITTERRVTSIRFRPDQAPSVAAVECGLQACHWEQARFPRDLMQPSQPLLTLEEARYRLLRQPVHPPQLGYTLLEVMAAAAARDDLESGYVRSIDWKSRHVCSRSRVCILTGQLILCVPLPTFKLMAGNRTARFHLSRPRCALVWPTLSSFGSTSR